MLSFTVESSKANLLVIYFKIPRSNYRGKQGKHHKTKTQGCQRILRLRKDQRIGDMS